MKNSPQVSIVLCTYNGSKFIRKQLDSIIEQTNRNWVIYASDDGSTDDTLAILNEYQEKLGNEKLIIVTGPKKGFAWNFIGTLKVHCQNSDYYAFCDQDDIWLPTKLEQAITRLEGNCEQPALYCSRTQLIDSNGSSTGLSPLFQKKPSLRNALIQSIAGGNTMVFNHYAKNIICAISNDKKIPSHDWYIYILLTAIGGYIYYDSKPMVLYRQHNDNIMGSNRPLTAKLERLKTLFKGGLKNSIEYNIIILDAIKQNLQNQNKYLIENFISMRCSSFPKRLSLLTKLSLYRQNSIETLLFYIAFLLKKA